MKLDSINPASGGMSDVELGCLLLGMFSLGVSVSMFAIGLWIKYTPDYVVIKIKK